MKDHRLLYHSTLGLRVTKKKKGYHPPKMIFQFTDSISGFRFQIQFQIPVFRFNFRFEISVPVEIESKRDSGYIAVLRAAVTGVPRSK